MRVGWERWEFRFVRAMYMLFSVGKGERGVQLV